VQRKPLASSSNKNHVDSIYHQSRFPAGGEMAKKVAKKKPATKTSGKKTRKKPTMTSAKVAPKKKPVKATRTPDEPREAVRTECTWVIWQDGRGIWVGTPEEFRQSKRPETIVCDVLNNGSHRDFDALQRAIHLGRVLRQTYANCVKPWLQYDDFAQEQRIREWGERLRLLCAE
jgi:hypothetical protein